MIRVFYANRLWGEYPDSKLSTEVWLNLPAEAYIYDVITPTWFLKSNSEFVAEKDVPVETRALNLIMGP